MIHWTSWDVQDLKARLTDKGEDVCIESDRQNMQMYLTPAMGFYLLRELVGCLIKIDLDEFGINDYAKEAYEQIIKLQALEDKIKTSLIG